MSHDLLNANGLLDALKRKGEIIGENAFEQKKKKSGSNLNPGLALIGLWTTAPAEHSLFPCFF